MYTNKIINNRYNKNNNIISIFKAKFINIMYIYKTKYTRKCIRVVITF